MEDREFEDEMQAWYRVQFTKLFKEEIMVTIEERLRRRIKLLVKVNSILGHHGTLSPIAREEEEEDKLNHVCDKVLEYLETYE